MLVAYVAAMLVMHGEANVLKQHDDGLLYISFVFAKNSFAFRLLCAL